MNEKKIGEMYEAAKETYAGFGINTDEVLKLLDGVPVSINCWQGDDVHGFENEAGGLSDGGILSTGGYPGRARDANELRADVDMAMSLIPGPQRINLHAMYAETDGKKVERDELETKHFSNWIDWAKTKGIGIDFNPSFFSHDKAKSGFTLSSTDKAIRDFWIRHAKVTRHIAADIGRELDDTCVNNLWIPDGCKDVTVGRYMHRTLLKDSLDEIYDEKLDEKYVIDFVECKLFGIGSESYVVGSHEFYMGYAMKNDVSICLDMGHFHPTEGIADKISAVLLFKDKLLLHVSRPVRWDSDHVVTFSDELIALMSEVNRFNAFERIFFAVDFFDGSINRTAAWIIGMRNTKKAILYSMLEPLELLRRYEADGDLGMRLALIEESKSLPFGAVWDMYCIQKGVPAGASWMDEVKKYEKEVLGKREA